MYRAFYEASEFLALPLVSAFLFVALFAGVVVWVLLTDKDAYRAVSALPLEHEEARVAAQEGKS
jgi:hypothetical protein